MSGIRLFRESDALIVVDVQPTFMPGGGLPVTGGDEVVPVVRELMDRFDIRFATLDKHRDGHISFASSYVGLSPMTVLTPDLASHLEMSRGSRGTILVPPHAKFSFEDLKTYLNRVGSQVLWPDHAVHGTPEAELHPEFSEDEFAFVQEKGLDVVCDSYSGFYDNLRRPTGFADIVARSAPKRLFICGLAFDFCVGWTALDACIALPNTAVFVVEDACRSVNAPDTVDDMKAKLAAKSVQLVNSDFWS